MLLVGNHSGGNITPDTAVFAAAFNERFGAERPFFQLAHDIVLALPWLHGLRRYGTVGAAPETARAALAAGAAVLVYPGGDWEVHRPSWEAQPDRVPRPPRIRPSRARDRRADRPGRLRRRAGDGVVPEPRRPSRPRAPPAPAAPQRRPPDLAGAALGPRRRRPPRPRPAAGQDHDRGARADRRRIDVRRRRRTPPTTRSSRACSRRSTGSPPSAAGRSSADRTAENYARAPGPHPDGAGLGVALNPFAWRGPSSAGSSDRGFPSARARFTSARSAVGTSSVPRGGNRKPPSCGAWDCAVARAAMSARR